MWDKLEDIYGGYRTVSPDRELLSAIHHIIKRLDRIERIVEESEFVRRRLMHEMPGYWDDSVKLGRVKDKLREVI